MREETKQALRDRYASCTWEELVEYRRNLDFVMLDRLEERLHDYKHETNSEVMQLRAVHSW